MENFVEWTEHIVERLEHSDERVEHFVERILCRGWCWLEHSVEVWEHTVERVERSDEWVRSITKERISKKGKQRLRLCNCFSYLFDISRRQSPPHKL